MIAIRNAAPADNDWLVATTAGAFGSMQVVRKNCVVDATVMPTLVAELDTERAGLLAYDVVRDDCEVVTLVSVREGAGVGRALLDAARQRAIVAGCRRLWLVTTNDNTRGLRLYQRWGMDIAALHRDAVTDARRRLKPDIPEHGADGIALRHELELELLLR